VVFISVDRPEAVGVKGTYAGTLSGDFDAISDFVGNLYPSLVRQANQSKLSMDPTDIAAGVEIGSINQFLGASASVRFLTNLLETGNALPDPLIKELTSVVFRRRARIQRSMERLQTFPFPPIYRQIIDYIFQPVMMGPGSPLIMAQPNFVRAERDLDDVADVDAILDDGDTRMDAIENSADELKFLNALQSFRPAWASEWRPLSVVIDPERVLMWRTRAVRNTEGATDRQNPNLEDTGFGNGQRPVLFTYGQPHPFQFTAFVPSITHEKDDRASGAAVYGSCHLQGNSTDDADEPAELTWFYGRTTPNLVEEQLDYAQGVTAVGTQLFPHFFYAARTWADNPSDYFAEGVFESVQTYEIELDDLAIESRHLLTQSWGLPI
jgi:hypothetical protein